MFEDQQLKCQNQGIKPNLTKVRGDKPNLSQVPVATKLSIDSLAYQANSCFFTLTCFYLCNNVLSTLACAFSR